MTKLLLFICLTAFTVQAQNIKIGDISISEALAKEYFLDCYKRPDTLEMEGGLYNVKEIETYKKKSISWKLIIHEVWSGKKYNLPDDERKRYQFLIAREPSTADFRGWFLRKAKLKNQ